ncbi:EAL domain-containing protein [Aquitalea sp. S1-19]|nr:EAL domain-containing protein [Aquitalea sp. S1-19]
MLGALLHRDAFDRLLIRLVANPALTAVISATVLIVPLVVLRALLQVLSMTAGALQWPDLAAQLQDLQAICLALVPLLLNIYMALYYAARDRLSPVFCVTAGICVLMVFDLVWQGKAAILPDSIPMALFAGFLSSMLLKASKRLPSISSGTAHGLVEQSINHMLSLIAITAGAALFAFLLAPLRQLLVENWLQWQASLHPTEFSGGLLYEAMRGISWLFGVNGHHLWSETSAALQQSSQINMAQWRAGEASLQLVSNTFFDVWCASGGSGGTLSLVLCMLLRARDKGYRQLARASLPLAFIHINEPVIFGVPVFFNPVMAIPFLLVPATGFVLAYTATWLGLVPVLQVQTGWMMPPLVNSWIASGGSFAAVLLQLLIIALGVAIYWPFFGWMEYRSQGGAAASGKLDEFTHATEQIEVTAQRHSYVADMLLNFRAQKEVETLHTQGHFVLYYQPQIELASGRITGAEALLRHQHTDGRIMAPTFIASFERLGLMPELDFWVLEHAIAAAHDLGQGVPFTLAINLSPQTLLDPRLGGVLDRLLATPLPAGVSLEIEITENQSAGDFKRFTANLADLRARGLRIALDDFGSGYSTLAYLTSFHFDKIKLDRSLVLALDRPDGRAFFASIVSMCRVCGARVLAEGVETSAELEQMKLCAVDVVQGYYFYRPMPMADLQSRLGG